MRPNVLLIVFDAARRDAFEVYDGPRGSTPAVSQLAARGAALPLAYSTACWTVPAHASIFTGLMPRAAGLGSPASPTESRPAVRAQLDRLLPEVMRRHGYATAAVSANGWLSAASGFDHGFDEFTLVAGSRQGRLHHGGLRVRAGWQLEALLARVDDGASAAGAALRRLIADRPSRRPFFWFVNLVECHSPYLPPRPWNDLPASERLRAAAEARRHLTLQAIWRACAGELDVPEETLERMRHLYLASIRYMDSWLGHLLEELDSAGALDETLVILTADHGENFGEGGLVTHALSLDERLIHVPLIAAGPGAPESCGPVSLAALPRLIAEGVGIDGPWEADELPTGAGVAQFEPLLDRADPRLELARTQWGLDDTGLARFHTRLACATDGRMKLLRRGDELLLFDLDSDPLELEGRPIAAIDDADPVKTRLGEALEHPSMTRSGEPVEPEAEDAVPEEELRAIEERMRLLGYM